MIYINCTMVSRQRKGVVSYPNRMEGTRYITQVDCIAVEKRLQPNKHHVYVLLVGWSSNTKYPVYRKYPEFFDLKSQLKEEFPDREEMIPELSAAKYFDRHWLFGFRDSNNEKKKRGIEEFCQKIIQLPFDISQSITVLSFFETWHSDSSHLPQSSIFHDRVSTCSDTSNNKVDQRNIDNSAYEDVDDFFDRRPRCSSLEVPLSAEVYSHASYPQSLTFTKGNQKIQEDTPSEMENNNLYRVICNHRSARPGDVNLIKGAILEVQEKSLSGWWFVTGEKGEVEGWAPGAFLEPLVESEATSKPPMEHEGEGTYQAVADYKARDIDEVSYKSGDMVEVLETSMDGWWKVRCGGKVGFSPAINLEKISGQKKVNSGLFHKKSRRRKGLPPRKNSDGGQEASNDKPALPVYAAVSKTKPKPPPLVKDDNNNGGSKPRGITYTEVSFEHDTSSRPVIIIKKEEKVTYSDILVPSSKQGLSPSPVSSTSSSPNGPLSPLAQRLSPVLPPRSPTRSRTPELDGRKMYENYPLPNKVQPYENIDLPVSEVIGIAQSKEPEKPNLSESPVSFRRNIPMLKTTKSLQSSSSQEDDSFQTGSPCEDSILAARLKLCNQPWFYGMMSRVDAEKLLSNGKHQDFLIRESTNRIGDFTLSVQFNGKARHFPIKLTKSDKYFIGKHNFKDMSRVVQYYQAQPLFFDEGGKPVSLGSPLERH